MAEYAVYHGGFSSSTSNKGLASIKADGTKLILTCPKEMMEMWESRLSPKGRISKYVNDGQVLLLEFVSLNPYEVWTGFTDDEGYDEFKDVYNSVKGVRKVFFVK